MLPMAANLLLTWVWVNRAMSRKCLQSVSLFLFLLIAGFAFSQQAAVDLPTIVQRMEQAALVNRTHYRPYVMTREYRLYGSDLQSPKSQVKAEISFVPPKHQDYKIVSADGNSHGETIVRHLLEDQTKAVATGQAPGAVTRANYDFRYVGEDKVAGRDCYVLQLLPKREEKSLIAGKAWIDKSTYLVRRIDGEMAKMPSWWLKSVHVTLDFDNFDGMWLQESTRAVADVRIIGKHTFTSNAVSIEPGTVEAKNVPASQRRRVRDDAVIGAGVIAH